MNNSDAGNPVKNIDLVFQFFFIYILKYVEQHWTNQ